MAGVAKGLTPGSAIGFAIACLALGLAAGLVWRPPFDDEAAAFIMIERLGMAELVRFYLAGLDVHAPLAFAAMKLLASIGVGDSGLRLASFLCAIAAFALALDVAWRLIGGGRPVRTLAFIVFATSPLVYGVGDAARWYSLLALFSALGLRWAFLGDGLTWRIGLALGLAFSTSFLAAIPILAVALWRYGWQRHMPDKGDLACWAVAALAGAPGLIALVNSLGNIGVQLGAAPLAALAYSAIGFFGGARLGLMPALLALPMLAWTVWALGWAVTGLARSQDRRSPADGALALVLAMTVACVALTASGFDKPRSYLFLAPWLCVLLALSLPALSRNFWGRALVLAAALPPFLAVAGSIRATDHPFKRDMALPVRQVISDVTAALPAPALVISGSPTLGYELHRLGYCVAARSLLMLCQDMPSAARDGVLIVRDFGFDRVPLLVQWRAEATRGKALVREMRFGRDAEAALKTRLSGVAFPDWLVTVEIWR